MTRERLTKLSLVAACLALLAACADDGMELAPVPSRRRISSANTTMSSFWLSVSIGTPWVVVPLIIAGAVTEPTLGCGVCTLSS